MVMTSDQIASQVAAFQQQSMTGMQHSGMVSQFAGMMSGRDTQAQAGNFMGSAMNTAGAVGQPIAQGGMMLAGVDPFSVGMRAAWAARGGGMAAAGGAGAAAAGLVGAPLMAGQYAGQQMFTGAGQQQQLNTQLGQTFQFANQHGGRGFTTPEMGDLGQMMRQMSQQRGPGGEFVTMDEMGQLASNLGRMGMAQGVRNAKDFNEKFQEMMKTVKVIATEMSTSLEQAQQMMSSMRGSGVFSQGGQMRMASAIRKGAVGGGMATEELSQMANIGSQVTRAVGGRGRAGAFAGVEAISRVGAAMQSGVLSEEDVYNATGQTGAAGRQAFATMMVQGDAQFFKGQLGRRVLASVAGKDGNVNQEDVDEYMYGGVGTNDTMRMAHQNMSKVGRANFIRNEGRLRGEATRAFGGMGRAVVARQWLGQRGMGLDDMDDRSMLFFQRKFKLDADQAESLIRMTRSMGAISSQRESAGTQDEMVRGLDLQRKGEGLEGVKRQFEGARKKINDSLRQVGADFYTEGMTVVEGFINKLTDNFVETVDRDIGQAAHLALQGGVLGRETLERRFGISTGAGSGRQSSLREMTRGGQMFGGGGADTTRRFVSMNRKSFQDAGYDISGASNAADLSQRMQGIQGMANGMFQSDSQALGVGSAMKDSVGIQAMQLRGRGAGRQASFQKVLDELAMQDKSGQAQTLAERYGRANGEERSRIMASVMRGAGVDTGAAMMIAPEEKGLFGSGEFSTIAERHRAMADFAFGGKGSDASEWREGRSKTIGQLARIGAAQATFGLSELLGADKSVQRGASNFARDQYGIGGRGGAGVREASMRVLDSEEGRDLLEGVTSGDSEVRAAATQRLVARSQKLLARQDAGGNLSRMEEGELLALQGVRMTGKLQELIQKHGSIEAADSAGALDDAVREFRGMGITSKEQFLQRARTGGSILYQKQAEARGQYFKIARKQGVEGVRALTAGGVLTPTGISGELDVALKGIGGMEEVAPGVEMSAGQRALRSFVKAQQARSQMGIGAGADERNTELERMAQMDLQQLDETMVGMTADEGRALAKQLRGVRGAEGFRKRALMGADVEDRLTKGFRGGGRAGAVRALAGMAGADIKQKDLQGRSAEEQSQILYETLAEGLTSEDMVDQAKLSDLDSQIRMETDPARRRKLTESREQFVKGGSAKLEQLRTLQKGVQKSLTDIESGDPTRVAAGKQGLEQSALEINRAGIVTARRDNQQEEAAKANDPSFRKLDSIATNTKDMITVMRTMSSSIVEAIKDKGGDSPGGTEKK